MSSIWWERALNITLLTIRGIWHETHRLASDKTAWRVCFSIPPPILRMTLKAHLVRIVSELQRCEVLLRVYSVRIVATSALSIAFPVARGTGERLDDKCCFPEAAVLIKCAAAEFAGWADGRRQYKRTCIGGIVQFVMVAHFPDCRLPGGTGRRYAPPRGSKGL
jgi:hypothetical protein